MKKMLEDVKNYHKDVEKLSIMNKGSFMDNLVRKAVQEVAASPYAVESVKAKKQNDALRMKISKPFEKLIDGVEQANLRPAEKDKLLLELKYLKLIAKSRFNLWTMKHGVKAQPTVILAMAFPIIRAPAVVIAGISQAKNYAALSGFTLGGLRTMAVMEAGKVYQLGLIRGSIGLIPAIQKLPETVRLLSTKNGMFMARDVMHYLMKGQSLGGIQRINGNITTLSQSLMRTWLPNTMKAKNIPYVNGDVFVQEVIGGVQHLVRLFQRKPVPQHIQAEFQVYVKAAK